MAVLKKMVDAGTIGAMRGVVDYYYWKSIPVARAWPRKARQPGTPKQQVTWNAFRAWRQFRPTVPASVTLAWRALPVPANRTQQDILKSHYLRLAYRDALFQLPEIRSASLLNPGDPTAHQIVVPVTPPDGWDPDALRWHIAPAQVDAPLLTWNRAGRRTRKDRYQEQLWAPNLASFTAARSQVFDPEANNYTLTPERPGPSYRLYARSGSAPDAPLFAIPPLPAKP